MNGWKEPNTSHCFQKDLLSLFHSLSRSLSSLPSPKSLRYTLTPNCRSSPLSLFLYDHTHLDHSWQGPPLCGQAAFNPTWMAPGRVEHPPLDSRLSFCTYLCFMLNYLFLSYFKCFLCLFSFCKGSRHISFIYKSNVL